MVVTERYKGTRHDGEFVVANGGGEQRAAAQRMARSAGGCEMALPSFDGQLLPR